MEWNTENILKIVTILWALIGAAYTAARGIVHLTETSNDDAWLEAHVGKPLKTIAKLFGLDLKQGRHTK